PIVGLGPMTCSNEVELLREVIKHSDAQIMRQSIRISNQRAQLAEAQALLREADEFMYIMTAHDGHAKLAHRYGKDWWDAIDKLRGKVCTALSASAEPGAPVERDEHQEFEQACREAAAARGRELDPETLRRRADGSHVNPLTECGWWGWQARAALERKL
ncbi:MAG: hypothetical protein QHC80_20540, partial [Pseudomonas sp.]|nr:hypothetical protein [Pseudomonas sp.]